MISGAGVAVAQGATSLVDIKVAGLVNHVLSLAELQNKIEQKGDRAALGAIG